MTDPCTCRHLSSVIRQAGARCGWCVQAIIEGKNTLVRENHQLRHDMHDLELIAAARRAEVERLRKDLDAWPWWP